ncbi:MAG: serine/threonine protein kinase, partial [Mycobacteriales bacterium]
MGPDELTEDLVGGRYRLLQQLDPDAWRASDEVLEREVLVARVTGSDELRSAARLDSPHAVRVFDVLQQDGQWFAVAERVDGPTLAELVRDGG